MLHPKNASDFPNQFQFGLERKKLFWKTQIPNQIQIDLESFDDHCQCPKNSKPNSAWFGKVTPKKCEGFYKPIPVWFGNKKNDLQDTDSKPNSDWFGTIWWTLSTSWKFQTSLCFTSPKSWSIVHPQVWLSSLLYKLASPLMGKSHLRRIQNISVLIFEEVPRIAAGHLMVMIIIQL